MAWLSGWSYRKSHVINSASGAETNYLVKIRVYYGSGTDSGGNVYVNGKCRTDFGDIRFTDDDGTTLLDYWMERKTNNDNADFWVEVADNLSSNNQTIYIYYGKSDATTTQNGDNVYCWGDDFEADILNWTATNCTFTQQAAAAKYGTYGGKMLRTANSHSVYRVFADQTKGFKLEGWIKIRDRGYLSTGEALHVQLRHGTTTMVWVQFHNNHNIEWWNGATMVDTGIDWVDSLYHFIEITGDLEANTATLKVDGVSASTFGFCVADPTTVNRVLLAGYIYDTDSWLECDNILIRKYVSPEPSHGAWGSEETPVQTRNNYETFLFSEELILSFSSQRKESLNFFELISRVFQRNIFEELFLTDKTEFYISLFRICLEILNLEEQIFKKRMSIFYEFFSMKETVSPEKGLLSIFLEEVLLLSPALIRELIPRIKKIIRLLTQKLERVKIKEESG